MHFCAISILPAIIVELYQQHYIHEGIPNADIELCGKLVCHNAANHVENVSDKPNHKKENTQRLSILLLIIFNYLRETHNDPASNGKHAKNETYEILCTIHTVSKNVLDPED